MCGPVRYRRHHAFDRDFHAFWGGAESAEPLRILAKGDSILAWHKWTGRNVSSEMGDVLGAQTDNATGSGARFSNRTEGGRIDVQAQYQIGA